MGQYWKFVNLDKMESFDPSGGSKMGEFFFNANPHFLRCLVTLPGPADDTSSMVERWAGDRILCLGDYVKDLPPGVITEDDQPLLEKLLVLESGERDEQGGYGQDYDGPALARRLYDEATSIADTVYYSWRCSLTDLSPINTVWALRNLSKKEFVRSDKIICGTVHWRQGSHVAFEHVPGLFQVLVMHTGWSEDGSCAMSYNEDYVPPKGKKSLLNEGAWAGERIDMVMWTDGGVQLKSKGWSDVSLNAFKQMRDIYDSEDLEF